MCIPLNESWSVAFYKLTKIGQFFGGKQPEMQMEGVAWIFDIPLSHLSDSKFQNILHKKSNIATTLEWGVFFNSGFEHFFCHKIQGLFKDFQEPHF